MRVSRFASLSATPPAGTNAPDGTVPYDADHWPGGGSKPLNWNWDGQYWREYPLANDFSGYGTPIGPDGYPIFEYFAGGVGTWPAGSMVNNPWQVFPPGMYYATPLNFFNETTYSPEESAILFKFHPEMGVPANTAATGSPAATTTTPGTPTISTVPTTPGSSTVNTNPAASTGQSGTPISTQQNPATLTTAFNALVEQYAKTAWPTEGADGLDNIVATIQHNFQTGALNYGKALAYAQSMGPSAEALFHSMVNEWNAETGQNVGVGVTIGSVHLSPVALGAGALIALALLRR